MFDDAIAAAALAAPHKPEVLPLVPGLSVHIDGDYLAYYAAGNDETEASEARTNALSLIDAFRARVGAEKVVVHNTAPGCHKGERYLVATTKPYQGQRSGRMPKNHGYLQDWLLGYSGPNFLSKTWTSREADDGIGACSHFALGTAPGYSAIATADKDMRMLPGLHIDWLSRQVTRVPPGAYDIRGENGKQYGLKWFWLQMLMGDAADNCSGLESLFDTATGKRAKIGEKGAEKLLAGTTSSQQAFVIVANAYCESYPSPAYGLDRFCEQAALMWMRLGNDAKVSDFAHHSGHSRINHLFDDRMWAAVARLEQRVDFARKTINALGSEHDPPSSDGIAG